MVSLVYRLSIPEFLNFDLFEVLDVSDQMANIPVLVNQGILKRSQSLVWMPELLRSFVSDEFSRLHPELYKQSNIDLARYFESNNLAAAASRHYAYAGEIDQAANLAEQAADTMAVFGQRDQLVATAQLFDETVSIPKLRYRAAIALIDGHDYEQGKYFLEQARHDYEKAGDYDQILRVEIQKALLHWHCGRNDTGIELLEQLKPRIKENTPIRVRLSYTRTYALCLHGQGENTKAARMLQSALRDVNNLQDAQVRGIFLQDIYMNYLDAGMIDDASTALQQYLVNQKELDDPLQLAFALNGLAVFQLTQGEFQDAQATLDEAYSLVEHQSASSREVAWLRTTEIELLIAKGDYVEAQHRAMSELSKIKASESALQCSLLLLVIDARYMMGVETDLLLRQLHEVAASASMSVYENIARHRQTGFSNQMLMDSEGWSRDDENALTYHIAAEYLRSNKPETAVFYLEKAQRAHVHRLALMILTNSELHELVQAYPYRLEKILQCIEAIEAFRLQSAPKQPSRLNVQILGTGLITCNDETLTVSDIGWTKSFELLVWLVYMQDCPSKRRKGAIIAALWPDQDVNKANMAFHRAVKLVRQNVGNAVLTYDNRSKLYCLDDSLLVKFELFALRDLVRKARQLGYDNPQATKIWHQIVDMTEQTATLDIDNFWFDEIRQEIEGYRTEALESLIYISHELGDYQRVVELESSLAQS